MTLSQNVADAVRIIDINDQSLDELRPYWQTIRAELRRLTAIAEGVDPLVVRLGEVTTELEAICATLPGVKYMDPPDGGSVSRAEQFRRMAKDASRLEVAIALLRDIKDWDVNAAQGACLMVPHSLRSRIQSHLQGAGDEA